MKVDVKKVTFTITRTETMEVEISVENGFDMPETMKEAIRMDDEIKDSPTIFIHDHNSWQLQSEEVSDIEYK